MIKKILLALSLGLLALPGAAQTLRVIDKITRQPLPDNGATKINLSVVENITDQLYRPYASGISAPGRNFILALRAQL